MRTEKKIRVRLEYLLIFDTKNPIIVSFTIKQDFSAYPQKRSVSLVSNESCFGIHITI